MAAFSIPYLRGVASKVADAFGLSVADASRIVGYYSLKGDGVGVSGCENLDITIIKAAADSVGVALPGSDADGSKADSVKDHGGGAAAGASKMTDKHEKPQKENNSLNNDIKARKTAKKTVKHGKNTDAIQENNTGINNARGADELPPGLIDTLRSIIDNVALSFESGTMEKAAQGQWSAACMVVGQYIKENKILMDAEKARKAGGRPYVPERVNSLIDIFAVLCGYYKKTPFIFDFIRFSGVSESYLLGKNGHSVLTSSGMDLYKKLQTIQECGVVSDLADGRKNPTGLIYVSKARFGWSENNNAAPIQEEKTQNVAALPVFGAPDDN